MGSTFNFRSTGNHSPLADTRAGSRPSQGGFPLTRHPSVYSLTFDEFQNTVGLTGKDFGSMNMDELLKNIWTVEENHSIGSTSSIVGQDGSGYDLQGQGSLTLPQTLSHKTVDEVWCNMSKDASGGSSGGFGVPQRQPTLGEITIEEFLMRAGVVREESPLPVPANNIEILPNGSALGFGFEQQQSSANLPLSVNMIPPAAQHMDSHHLPKPQQQQQQILPKQSAAAYGSSMGIPGGGQLGSPRVTGSAAMSNAVALQGEGLVGMVGLGANAVTVAATGSPALSSDGFIKSNGDMSLASPVPYVFNSALRGRRNATIEKAVERRQRRMIKNRESAARSRARKQAYTTELEAEIAKLKEEQEALQQKQAKIIEMQKNQVLEMIKQQSATKRQGLRRTQTGLW